MKEFYDMKLVFHINHKGFNYADNLGKIWLWSNFDFGSFGQLMNWESVDNVPQSVEKFVTSINAGHI